MSNNEFHHSSESKNNGNGNSNSQAKSANLSHATANMSHAKEKLSEGADAALKGVIELLEAAGYEVKKHSMEGRVVVEDYIKVHPLKAMGFSVMAGAVVALLLKR